MKTYVCQASGCVNYGKECESGIPGCVLATVKDKPSGPDMVNDPPHYKGARLPIRNKLVRGTDPGGSDAWIDIEPADVVEAFGLHSNHYLATVFYYIVRAGKKGPALMDLQKARWFLEREIARVEREK